MAKTDCLKWQEGYFSYLCEDCFSCGKRYDCWREVIEGKREGNIPAIEPRAGYGGRPRGALPDHYLSFGGHAGRRDN